MDQVEGIFRPRISFKYLAGNSGIKLGSGQLLQQGGFFSLLGFQESGKIVLRQQYGTRKLFEGQADQFDDTGLQIGTRPLLFLLLVEVVQRQTRILQPSVFLVTRPRHRPACPVAVSVQGHEIHLCKTRSRPPPQQETGIALRQLFITDILKLDIIFFCLVGTRRTGEQSQAHRIQKRGLASSRRSGNGKDPGREQRLYCKVYFKITFQRGQVTTSYR